MAPPTQNSEELLPAPPKLGQTETVAAMLSSSKRIGRAVPLRTTFVQQGTRGNRRRGPLADFVVARDEIALDLFLLALASASAPPHDVVRPTEVWLRALGRDPGSKPSAAAVSRAWKRLADRRLITRVRQGRLIRIGLCREDGSGAPYSYPTGSSAELYLKVPFVYWTENLHTVLSLRAKAMLLVALSLQDGFVLPYERVPGWYGISADTAQRGLKELNERGLIQVLTGYKPAPLTAQGWTAERRYTLDERFRVPAVRTIRRPRPTNATRTGRAGTRSTAERSTTSTGELETAQASPGST